MTWYGPVKLSEAMWLHAQCGDEDQRALKSPGACRKLGFLKSLWPGMSRLGTTDGVTKMFPLFPSNNADPCPHLRFAHSGGVASLCKISLSPPVSKNKIPNS